MFFKENGMGIDNKLIDELLKEYRRPEDIIGENGLLKQLTKALIERAMNAELTQQLDTRSTIRRGTTAATRGMARVRRP